MNTGMQINYTETQSVNANTLLESDSVSEYTATLGGSVQEYDVQIANATNEMQEIAMEKSDVRADQSLINSCLDSDSEIKTDTKGRDVERVEVTQSEWEQISGGLGDEYGLPIVSTDTDTQTRTAVQKTPGIFLVSKEYLENLKTKQQSKLDNLNSSSELKMISFQALMDSRKQALLQLSNLYSSSSEIAMEIIRNMK